MHSFYNGAETCWAAVNMHKLPSLSRGWFFFVCLLPGCLPTRCILPPTVQDYYRLRRRPKQPIPNVKTAYEIEMKPQMTKPSVHRKVFKTLMCSLIIRGGQVWDQKSLLGEHKGFLLYDYSSLYVVHFLCESHNADAPTKKNKSPILYYSMTVHTLGKNNLNWTSNSL